MKRFLCREHLFQDAAEAFDPEGLLQQRTIPMILGETGLAVAGGE